MRRRGRPSAVRRKLHRQPGRGDRRDCENRGRRTGDRRLRSRRYDLQQGDDLRFQAPPAHRALRADHQPDRRDVAGVTIMPDLSYDPAALAPRDRYKMLISLVIPRPIALVTTIGPTGVVNAAPF